MSKRKAVALISGGLDSMLAAKLMLDQGIHVEGLNFFTGFCVEGHTHAIRKQAEQKNKRNNALWCAEQLGIKLHIIDIVEEYKDVVINPQYGYGANMNPCLDCKIFMVKQAKQWMEANGFDFIITGEVIGQRPMSQHKQALPLVQKQSGIFDLLVRPLCAKNLAPTLPEREGWIDREQLLNIHGRGRKRQIAIANAAGYHDHAQPAGGCCFLTDKSYSNKLKDLWQNRGEKRYELDDIMLLKIGRHLRPKPNFKMIVSREEGENNFLEGYRKQFRHFRTVSHNGPLVLIDGTLSEEDIELAASIVARFSKGKSESLVDVQFNDLDGTGRLLKIKPMPEAELLESWYINERTA